MGEILAVTNPLLSLRRRGGRAVLAVAACAMLTLSACGNDTSRTEGSKIALGMAKELKNRVFGAKSAGTGAPPDPEKLAEAAKRSFAGPIILAQLEKSGLLTVLGEYGRNGNVRTSSTANKQTLRLRAGLLTAARGLGNDLMSAETTAAARLVLARQPGTAEHVYRYLDGEDIERPLPLRCTVTSGAAKSFTFSGTTFNTVEMTETCQATTQALSVTNQYWVTGSGVVALSRQWIGPALGYVTIQTVRP